MLKLVIQNTIFSKPNFLKSSAFTGLTIFMAQFLKHIIIHAVLKVDWQPTARQ
jgi:hypothetical protein